jgi:predicted signal transduction protein with EAL and GGDEF domain
MEEALLAAERVREAFAACGMMIAEMPVDTTVSIGVAGGPVGTELDVLLAAADTALYQAKRAGRNRVQSASEEPVSLEQGRLKTAGQVVAAPPSARMLVGIRTAHA